MPTFEQQGYGSELDQAADVSRHPVLRQFPTRFVRNSVSGNQRVVVLTKDHRLPFVTVTKGEYLQAVEAAIARMYDAEQQKIARDNKGNQRSIDSFMGYLNAKHEKRVAVVRSNREKYKTRLQETAEIWNSDPNMLLENVPDVFESGGRPGRLTVYTIDPRVIELCKTDTPQWIVVYWTAHLNDPINLSLHQAILNNVDFQYIYDYFFDPGKVKGQPYKPLRSPRSPRRSSPASHPRRRRRARRIPPWCSSRTFLHRPSAGSRSTGKALSIAPAPPVSSRS